jgi:alpha-N-acetylglucosamine transferase
VLKQELEVVDHYLESKKAEEFKAEFRAFLSNETIAEWRSDEMQKHTLVDRLDRIDVDMRIIRLSDNNTFTSGIRDTNVISTGPEKQCDDNAGSHM